MKAISILLYEVGIQELRTLPECLPVLQYDSQYDAYLLKHSGRDSFPTASRFKFFLFNPPPLPNVSEEYITTGEVQ